MADTETAIEAISNLRKEKAAAISARRDAAPLPPSVQSLCLEHTLYAPIQLNPERDVKFLNLLKFGAQQFDAHCVYCGKGATFRTLSDRTPEDVAQEYKFATFNESARLKLKRVVLEDGQFALHLGCSRRPDHLYSYFFSYDATEAVLKKVGQTPSLEDVAGAEIERYRKILGDDFVELRKATGLFAHGIGIGAFVYLRRIFENLVEDARSRWDPEGEHRIAFNNLRMAERIKQLEAFLPDAVVKFKDAYGVISKGIHELTEAECKQCFPVIRAAIIMMLEQKYEAAEKAKAATELERAIAAIASENKNG